MCCFSVAAHRLLFIICTVLHSSYHRHLLRDTNRSKSCDFSVAAEILLNYFSSSALAPVFMLQDAVLFFPLFSLRSVFLGELIHLHSFSYHFHQKDLQVCILVLKELCASFLFAAP